MNRVGAVIAFAVLAQSIAPVARAHDDHGNCRGLTDFELSAEVREAAAKLKTVWQSELFKLAHAKTQIQLLAINDFHGHISTGQKVAGRPVGGAAVLASYLRSEESAFKGSSMIVHAGDQVGASPPESALLQDEPAITLLNMLGNKFCSVKFRYDPLCNMVGTLGNHEFDEGIAEIKRLLDGGNYKTGPFLTNPWTGAALPYVSANVVNDDKKQEPFLPPFTIQLVDGLPVAFIGAVLKDTPSIVSAAGVAGVKFLDEADSINEYVPQIRKLGVETIVVLIHQGGFQTPTYTGETMAVSGPPGPIADIVSRLDSAIDVVVSGHTHSFTNALVNNSAGHPILVTQAFSYGTAYGAIELTIDRSTRDVVQKSARIVTTYGDAGPGLTPAADVSKLVSDATSKVGPLINRVVGTAASAITATQDAAGESSLGDLIADSQRVSMNAQIALMNPGGIRANIDAGTITWGDLFTVEPFGDQLIQMNLTGAQIKTIMEQQWADPTQTKFLQISGITESWDPGLPVGGRITSLQIAGTPIDPTQTYTVVANSFLAGGGDGFTGFKAGTNQIVGQVDLDALVSYVQASAGPIDAPPEERISKP